TGDCPCQMPGLRLLAAVYLRPSVPRRAYPDPPPADSAPATCRGPVPHKSMNGSKRDLPLWHPRPRVLLAQHSILWPLRLSADCAPLLRPAGIAVSSLAWCGCQMCPHQTVLTSCRPSLTARFRMALAIRPQWFAK